MPETVVVRVVPRRSLLKTAVLSFLLTTIPVFGALYWLAAAADRVLPVVILHVAVSVGALVLLLRQLSVDVTVTDREIRGHGFLSPMVRVPLDRIATLDLVPVHLDDSPEPSIQLLIRDAHGSPLFRMRGAFWHPGDLERVAGALPVPARRAERAVSADEFARDYPGSVYWFERRPTTTGVVLVGVTLVAIGAVLVGLSALGVPTGLLAS